MNNTPSRFKAWPHASCTHQLRIVGVLLLTAALVACSGLSLMYSQANTVVYLWADKYADFNAQQKPVFKARLAEQLKWHRQHELPRYIAFMERHAALAPGEPDEKAFCQMTEDLQQAFRAMLTHSAADLAEVAVTAEPTQLAHMQKALDKGNRDWIKKHMPEGMDKQRHAHFKELLERYEDFYGSFDHEQEKFLQQQLLSSPWDAQRWLNERKRRQQVMLDMLQTLRGAEPAVAKQKIEALIAHYDMPTDTQEQQWLLSHRAHGCKLNAAVHQHMSAHQRLHAQKKLLDYAADFRQLMKSP